MKIDKNTIENSLFKAYSNMINVDTFSEGQFDISLPIFLNTGTIFNLILERTNSKIILKNTIYSQLEDSLNRYISYNDLRKKYLLNNKKFKEIKKEKLLSHSIDNSLLQEKDFIITTEENFLEEVFTYVFNVATYYNYVYDYITENLKVDDKAIFFREAFERYIENYNKSAKRIFRKIEGKDFISTYNPYYYDGESILTGANNKLHFLEALTDLENLLDDYRENLKEIKILKNKIDLKEEYINKILKSKKNIKDIIKWEIL